VKLRALAWGAAGLLWASEFTEGIADPRLLAPSLDWAIDSLTVVASVTLIGWWLLDRAGLRPAVTRAEYEANRSAVTSMQANFARLGQGIAEATEPAPQLRCVRDGEAVS
jgi:hypothetical protein